MATIKFKAKIERVTTVDGSLAWEDVKVPRFTRKHCDMKAFAAHPVYGHAARCGVFLGKDVFIGELDKLRKTLFPNGRLRLDRIPNGVGIDRREFLAVVTIDV